MERNLSELKRPALLEIAKKAKIKGYSQKKKSDLIKMIQKHKGVDVKVKDKNKKSDDNRVYVNIYCSGAHVETSGAPQTQRFMSETSTQTRPQTRPQPRPPMGKAPVRKFAPVKTTKPIQKIPPAKISAKAQKLKEKTASELKKLPKSRVSSDFKSRLEGLFSGR